MCRSRGVWKISITPPQFCSQPKTRLSKLSSKKKKESNKLLKHSLDVTPVDFAFKSTSNPLPQASLTARF